MDIKTIILRFFIAVLCGAVIGLEREIRDKAAGLRTHVLVCIGACLFGMVGLEMVAAFNGVDILRIAQGLLIGMGFLGAGVIIREGASITGLTTAAGIWVMGAIGLGIGIGAYRIALIGTIFCLLTIALFGAVERLVKK